MLSKILQTSALIVACPFLWLFHGIVFTLVIVGQTLTAIGKVWRAQPKETK